MKQLRRSPKRTGLLLTLGGFALLAALLLAGALQDGRAVGAELAATPGEGAALLRELGWETDPASATEKTVHIPERFGRVFENYNELQRQQGYDLAPYRGRDVTLYTYAVTNWPDESLTVLADLYTANGRVIGGDVHAADLGGFMIGLK